MSTVPAKICQICQQDCSKKPRVKDAQGRYSCEACVAQKKAEAALLAGADPAPGPERKPIVRKPSPPKPAPVAAPADDEALPAGFWDQPASVAATAAPIPAAARCGQCGGTMMGGSVICTACGFNAQTGKKMKVKTGVDGGLSASGVAKRAGNGAFRMGLWLVGGGIAGAIGLAVWVAILVYAQLEIGYVAVGVGALVGAGVAITGQRHLNALSGMVAGAIAFFCVAGWKIAAYFLFTAAANAAPDVAATMLEDQLAGPNGNEVALDYYVYGVAIDMESKGQTKVWPDGLEAAGTEERKAADLIEYPEKVQKETKVRWEKLSAADRETFKQRVVSELRLELQSASQSAQGEMASAFTVKEIAFMALWTILACGVAFSIGANGFNKG